MIEQPDLTPGTYTQRARSRAALRQWMLVCGLFAVVALLPISLAGTRAPDASSARAQEQLTLAQSRVTQSKNTIKALQAQLAQNERELQAEKHLTQRPDWSAVLTLVAQQFDQDLVMSGFQLGGVQESSVRGALGPMASDVPEGSVWLIVSGMAESNSNVSGLILRLEKLGLFEQVVMTGAKRESFAGDQRTGFTLACRVQ